MKKAINDLNNEINVYKERINEVETDCLDKIQKNHRLMEKTKADYSKLEVRHVEMILFILIDEFEEAVESRT